MSIRLQENPFQTRDAFIGYVKTSEEPSQELCAKVDIIFSCAIDSMCRMSIIAGHDVVVTRTRQLDIFRNVCDRTVKHATCNVRAFG